MLCSCIQDWRRTLDRILFSGPRSDPRPGRPPHPRGCRPSQDVTERLGRSRQGEPFASVCGARGGASGHDGRADEAGNGARGRSPRAPAARPRSGQHTQAHDLGAILARVSAEGAVGLVIPLPRCAEALVLESGRASDRDAHNSPRCMEVEDWSASCGRSGLVMKARDGVMALARCC
jgi:hypothetical protein